MNYKLFTGNCLEILPAIPDKSVNAVISDPPYPGIVRKYGCMDEEEWLDMMKEVVRQCRRVLTDSGSCVFILQPNQSHVGTVRHWFVEYNDTAEDRLGK